MKSQILVCGWPGIHITLKKRQLKAESNYHTVYVLCYGKARCSNLLKENCIFIAFMTNFKVETNNLILIDLVFMIEMIFS